MMITNVQIKKLLESGGSVVLDASKYSVAQMKVFATAASASGGKARITFKKVDKYIPKHLIDVAALAPGQVVFDLS